MGMDSFAPGTNVNGCFIVYNMSPQVKTINIFTYPINYHCFRDLIQIPGVSEGSIRASLLKGELRNKIRVGDIIVVCSDIDLLQFNAAQKAFLQSAGIVNGLSVTSTGFPYLFRDDQPLIGVQDGTNRSYFVPPPDKFLTGTQSDGNIFEIFVTFNGLKQEENIDYVISESGGAGTGFDTVSFINKSPKPNTIIRASYVVAAP
jgi:hypothetical protein